MKELLTFIFCPVIACLCAAFWAITILIKILIVMSNELRASKIFFHRVWLKG